ncbi:hypothetical protein ACFLZG_05535 [Thermodesulfobacteriota bacterium]
MISKEAEKLLILVEKIEKTMSEIYGSLAINQSFGDEVRRFWTTMMDSELEHVALFRNIRKKAQQDKAVQIELNFNANHLMKSYQKIKKVQKIVIGGELSEKQAYTLGANLEEKLHEFTFCKRIKSNNKNIMNGIRKVDEDTKHHYFLLHNYSLDGLGSSINR